MLDRKLNYVTPTLHIEGGWLHSIISFAQIIASVDVSACVCVL